RTVTQQAFEDLDPARGPPDLEPFRADHRDTGRVVAPVLEALETVQDDVDGALLADVADDATHIGTRRGASPPFRTLPPGIVAPAKPALEARPCRATSFYSCPDFEPLIPIVVLRAGVLRGPGASPSAADVWPPNPPGWSAGPA